ncbi:MAG TPA: hypothetical protein VFW90_04080, partial [Candidatus Saccharimonadales bacterium]|nr:hypothetical protein [Candidatus Saccharimonadales bacterium]
GIRGRLSEASKDFYMEIAVALGQFGQPMVTRAQMQKFCLDREVIRTQAKGKPVEEKPLSDKTWGHVNRIYRGSLGNEEVAVNTYETVYYGGFRPIAEYVRKQLAAGRSMDGIFGELTCARIDPTNPQDIEYRDGVIDNGDQDG